MNGQWRIYISIVRRQILLLKYYNPSVYTIYWISFQSLNIFPDKKKTSI